MKLTIERAALLRSLAHVQSVVERRNTIPILSNVLMEVGSGRLGLTATDMDLTIHEETEAAVHEPGATTAAGGRSTTSTPHATSWRCWTCRAASRRTYGGIAES